MAEKNPYENNGVYIPDFVDKSDKDVDMTSFKMDLEDIQQSGKYDYDEDSEDEDYEDDDDQGGSGNKAPLIVCIIIMIILLLAAVIGWGFYIGEKNKNTQISAEKSEIEQKLITANEKISSLEAASKGEDEEEGSEGESSEDEYETYKANDVINVRNDAGSKTYASSSDLSDEIKESLSISEDSITTKSGVSYKVYESKTVDGMLWGRIDKNAWFCLDYATKQ